MKNLQAYDSVGISSRYVTDEGFLVAKGVISRTGTQTYLAGDLGLDGDPTRKVVLFRPESEVFSQDSIASFQGKPITINHPPVLVTKDNWKEYSHGDVSNVSRIGNEFVGADMVFKTDKAIAAINSGKQEISNGYKFTLDMTSGVTANGEAYDGIQRNIRGNHVALVDKARCGSACRVNDEVTHDVQPKKEELSMSDKKVVVDGIPLEVSETAAGVIEKLAKDRDEALEMVTAADAKVAESKEALEKAVADHAKEIDELKKDVITPEVRDALVGEWSKMLETVSKHSTIAADGKTCAQIRREFVAQMIGDADKKAMVEPIIGSDIELATSDSIKSAFGVLAAVLGSKHQGNQGEKAVADALLGKGKVQTLDARSLFIQQQTAR